MITTVKIPNKFGVEKKVEIKSLNSKQLAIQLEKVIPNQLKKLELRITNADKEIKRLRKTNISIQADMRQNNLSKEDVKQSQRFIEINSNAISDLLRQQYIAKENMKFIEKIKLACELEKESRQGLLVFKNAEELAEV